MRKFNLKTIPLILVMRNLIKLAVLNNKTKFGTYNKQLSSLERNIIKIAKITVLGAVYRHHKFRTASPFTRTAL